MKKFALALSLVVIPTFMSAGCSDGADPEPSSTSAKVTSEVVAALKSQNRTRVIVSLRQRTDARMNVQGLSVTRSWKHIPGFAAELDQAALDALRVDPNVEYVEIDGQVRTNLTQSTALVRSDKANAAGHRGEGKKVVVIDTGIAANHPSLAGKVVDEACFCTGQTGGCCPNGETTQTGQGSSADDEGHGSHVAGIVAGVAPGAKLVAVKVLSAAGEGSDSGILSALDWVLENHPDAVAVNMSLGDPSRHFATDCDSSLRSYSTVINNLRAKGVLTVVASGNEAKSTGIAAPACIGNSFSVGSVYDANVGRIATRVCTDNTTAADQVSCFSNSANNLDILAPGAMITSVSHTGGTAANGGTSQAAPHVAGAAAVLSEANSALGPADIEDILKTTGVSITDPRNNITRARINVEAAANEAVRRGQPQL